MLGIKGRRPILSEKKPVIVCFVSSTVWDQESSSMIQFYFLSFGPVLYITCGLLELSFLFILFYLQMDCKQLVCFCCSCHIYHRNVGCNGSNFFRPSTCVLHDVCKLENVSCVAFHYRASSSSIFNIQ